MECLILLKSDGFLISVVRYLPNASETTRKNFEDYLKILNRLEFGSFDEFVGIDDWNIEALEHIDLFELYQDVRNAPFLNLTHGDLIDFLFLNGS